MNEESNPISCQHAYVQIVKSWVRNFGRLIISANQETNFSAYESTCFGDNDLTSKSYVFMFYSFCQINVGFVYFRWFLIKFSKNA